MYSFCSSTTLRSVLVLIALLSGTGDSRRFAPSTSERKSRISQASAETSESALIELARKQKALSSVLASFAWFRRRGRNANKDQNTKPLNELRGGASATKPTWMLDKEGNYILSRDATDEVVLDLVLNSAAAVIPHPEKASRIYKLPPHVGGEDAYFIDADSGVLGVADGVGGWADQGVDPGIFSRQLMNFAAEESRAGESDPKTIMTRAHSRTTALGSSTALIVSLVSRGDGSGTKVLKAANMGDSGFLHLRRGEVLYESESQQHYFNAPYQLGAPGTEADSDSPRLAQTIEREDLKVGDVFVLGSDGLLDNLFPEEIAAIVFDGRNRRPSEIADEIARKAHVAAKRKYGSSPFGVEAKKAGYTFQGGKLDDITVIVAVVERGDPEIFDV